MLVGGNMSWVIPPLVERLTRGTILDRKNGEKHE